MFPIVKPEGRPPGRNRMKIKDFQTRRRATAQTGPPAGGGAEKILLEYSR
jgi:hypothetical protein